MNVGLAYGDGRLEIALPRERTTIVSPQQRPPAPDAATEVRSALRSPVAGPPLRDVVTSGQTVAISVCDGTRPQPRELVLRAIIEELDGIVRPEDILVLVATGTHRANTQAEMDDMFGRELARNLEIINHDARDDGSLTWIGRLGADVPVWLNKRWVDADIRITTGFVEPHFFAGFSGGPKMVAPGLAGLDTVLELHNAARIGHPSARWGITEGNPIHDDVRAIAAATGVHFALDVILDAKQRVVQAFGGELFSMHRAACVVATGIAMRPLPSRFDVVVTSNSGYPLDQNLYQSVKGMSAAAQIVKDGGLIVCVAECRDGFPDHGSYRRELASAPSPRELLESVLARSTTVPDQWQIQIQAAIQSRARVVMHTSFLSDAALAEVHLEQTADVASTIDSVLEEAGPMARVCALPEGPQTIPYLAGRMA
jgi:nickel-dependent lactate racemase